MHNKTYVSLTSWIEGLSYEIIKYERSVRSHYATVYGNDTAGNWTVQ